MLGLTEVFIIVLILLIVFIGVYMYIYGAEVEEPNKKKKQTPKSFPSNKPEDSTTQDEQDGITDCHYTVKSLPQQYRNNRVSIREWKKADGDLVIKGEHLIELEFEDETGVPLNAYSSLDGVLEIFKYSSNDIHNPFYLKENEKIYTIHTDADEQKILELKHKRFRNIPIVRWDEFSGTKEIKWASVAGRKKPPKDSWSQMIYFEPDIYDSFIFSTNEEDPKNLIFTLNNIENKDFIVFKYSSKQYRLTVGARISFLFNNGETLVFEIKTKPHKHGDDENLGRVFETRVPLTTTELETLKSKGLSKWQIDFARTNKKITGIIDSQDYHFAVNKLANEYYELVQKEIENYEPITDKQEKQTKKTSDNGVCHVYLMIDLTNNYHKIGISNKPKYRERTLQSEKPSIEMVCNKRFPNRKIAKSFEQALHQSYSDKRVRGEWFNLSDNEVQDLIEALTV